MSFTDENMTTAVVNPSEPLLRTLSPALRQLERHLRQWLDAPRRYPLGTMQRATLEGLCTDLRRQAEALDVDRPLLVIVLMGGTGVGKSTLLNALAGGTIAQASFARPTTRDPVVYYHESLRTERLDVQLQHCRLAPHDRRELEQKIIVDTPDLDSNDLVNREKLARLLPVADVVLYVGSQEKYHDRLGWDLFLDQRKRHAFAFILNKWDRCVAGATTGLRPDEDLLNDLQAEGFEKPLLFRTCAQHWVDRAGGSSQQELPAGEQFHELTQWLEMGLSRLEIEAIKARGVSQLLQQLQDALTSACPPDLTEVAGRTRAAWEKPLREEAGIAAEVLLNTLEPYQREVEHHFALQGQRRFRGMMAWYLQVVTRLKFIGSNLRDRIHVLPRLPEGQTQPPAWDLSTFTHACSDVAAQRHLDARGKALANRLLLAADEQGFPMDLLGEAVESAAKTDWRQRYAQMLGEVLHRVEETWTRPSGSRRWLHASLVFFADWIPLVVLLATCGVVLWEKLVDRKEFVMGDLVLPAAVVLITLVMLHVLIALLMPLRWSAIRGEFHRVLEEQLGKELEATYSPAPELVAGALQNERRQAEQLQKETREVAEWLAHREQAASIAGLYGR